MTGPEPVVLPITPPPNGRTDRLAAPVAATNSADGAVEVDQVAIADDPADTDSQRLVDEVAEGDLVGGILRRRGVSVETDLGRDLHRPQAVVRAADQHDPVNALLLQEPGSGGQALPRIAAAGLEPQCSARYAGLHQVHGAGVGLGEAVADLAAARQHDDRRDLALVQLDGVIEP